MKKTLFILILLSMVSFGCGQKETATINNQDNSANFKIDSVTANFLSEFNRQEDCPDFCDTIMESCGPLVSKDICNSECLGWSDETVAKIYNAYGCEVFLQNEEFIGTLIPNMEKPQMVIPETSDCEAACGNYVVSCLTLVPNATEALFAEGLDSCMVECLKWNTSKIGCMINAHDCESMTDVCGL